MLSAREWTHGEEVERPRRTELRAGPLTLLLEGAELRSIRLGSHEVIRRIYAAVRDRNWGTVPARLSEVRQEVGADSFRVTFRADHRERDIHFTWGGAISGDPDGTIRYSMDGEARTTFLRNRIGFCVLHPDRCAGARCRVVHAGGGAEEARLPEAISPHQPFLDLRAFAHEVEPDRWAELAFEGEVFEMEDQRNWTDASFKTYCTPLHLPYPVEIPAGTRVVQAVTLRVPGAVAAPRQAPRLPAYAIDRSAPVRPLPALGLGVASHGQPLSAREIALLGAVHPAHLRVDVAPAEPGWEEGLRRAAEQARALGCALEAALVLSDASREELSAVAALVPALGCGIARWLVFHRDEAATTERWVSLAHQVLAPASAGVPVAAGAKAYFTELNRGPQPTFADQVVFSVNPQIHAFDDASLVETLRMQRLAAENAARLSGGRPVVVSPVTLRPRFNAVATGPVAPPAPGELPEQVDVRQMSLFGAAWTLGSLANLAASGAASLTYYETTGWRGLVELASGPPAPRRFPALPGCAFPLYHVLADAGDLRGGALIAGESSAPLLLEGLTMAAGGRLRTLLANLTGDTLEARVSGAPEFGWVRALDLASVEGACRDPVRFRGAQGERVASQAGELHLTLSPFATARIDWE